MGTVGRESESWRPAWTLECQGAKWEPHLFQDKHLSLANKWLPSGQLMEAAGQRHGITRFPVLLLPSLRAQCPCRDTKQQQRLCF